MNNTIRASVSINNVLQYWDKRPCNIKHSNQTFCSREYFDEVEIRKYFVEPHIPKFAEFEHWKYKKVLEIGCGIGTDAINFARHGAIYTGIELSSSSLDITKKRFKTFNLDGKLINGNAENLSNLLAPDEKFDLVYSFGVLHHTPYPEKVFSAITKRLNPGGELRIMLYARNSLKSFLIQAGLEQPEAQYGCPIANTYTKEQIYKLLSDFKITSIKQDHIFPYIVDEYKNYRYKKEPWIEAMSEEMFSVLEHELGWHLLIKAKLHRI